MQALLNGMAVVIAALSLTVMVMLFVLIITYKRAKRTEGMILSLHEYHQHRIKTGVE